MKILCTYSTGLFFLRTSFPTMFDRMKTGISLGSMYHVTKPAQVAKPKEMVKVSWAYRMTMAIEAKVTAAKPKRVDCDSMNGGASRWKNKHVWISIEGPHLEQPISNVAIKLGESQWADYFISFLNNGRQNNKRWESVCLQENVSEICIFYSWRPRKSDRMGLTIGLSCAIKVMAHLERYIKRD